VVAGHEHPTVREEESVARTTPVAVVGAGIVGLSTAYALLERGVPVTVYERGVPGSDQSGGESRLFRHAHDDPRLIEAARTSRGIWEAWSRTSGAELVSRDGVVAIGSSVEERLPLLDQVGGVDARRVDAATVREHLPLLAPVDGPAMLDADGGAIRTRAAIDLLVTEVGDGLVADEVLQVRPTGRGSVEVRAGGSEVEHEHVVVCAGRGSAALARAVGLSLPVDLQAHVRSTFAVRGEPPGRLACLQDSSGAFGETGVYAAPTPGNRAYAVGLSETVAVRDDGSVVDPAALADLDARARRYVERALPGLEPDPIDVRHCWVTALPWSDDGVAVWQEEGLSVVAGHNLFKLAPRLGRSLAAVATGEGLPDELRPEARLGAPRG
jgi:sarcosine oxidase